MTREVTTRETASPRRDNPPETEETDTTEDLDPQEEITAEEGPDLQEEMTMVEARAETQASTIEIGKADPTETETTDLVMKAEEEIGEEMTPEMETGIEEAEKEAIPEIDAIEMSPEAEETPEIEEEEIPEIEETPEDPEELNLKNTTERIATPRIEEELLKLETIKETSDQRAEIPIDAQREDLLALTKAEMKSPLTDPIMMTRYQKDEDHLPTELRLITLTKSLRKDQRRSKMARLRMLNTFEVPGEYIFNQRNA